MSVPTMHSSNQANEPARHRPGGLPVWAWVLIAVGVVGMGLAACTALFVGMNAYLTHDLLHEDFTAGSGAFAVGEEGGRSYAVQDGRYAIAYLDDSPGGAFAFADLARYAGVVDASVDVVRFSNGPDDFVGVGCATAKAEDGYYLVARPGSGQAALLRMSPNDLEGMQVIAEGTVSQAAALRTLRLTCRHDPFDGSTDLVGYVNGTRVVEGSDAVGTEGFWTVVLALGSPDRFGFAAFDNVDVVVPE